MPTQKTEHILLKEPDRYPAFVLESEQGLYFCHGETVQTIQSLQECSCFVYYLLDFPYSEGPGTIQISGDPRYADVLARKRLEDRGELSPGEKLWIYKKSKLGKTEAELLYHIFPEEKYNQLLEQQHTFAPGLACLDPVGLGLAWLEQTSPKQDTAIVISLLNSLLLLVGRRQKIELVRRYAQFQESAFGSGQSTAILEQDLKDFEQNKARSLDKLIWLEIWQEDRPPEMPELDYQLDYLPLSSLSKEQGEKIYTCLPQVLKRISPKHAFLGREETWLRPLEKGEKYLWMGLLLILLVSFSLTWTLQCLNKQIQARSKALSEQIQAYENTLQSFSFEMQGKDYQKVLKMANKIIKADKAHPYSAVWSMLARISPQNIKLNYMELNYQDSLLKLQLQGFMNQGMIQGQKAFSDFIHKLREQGFEIVKTDLDLKLHRVNFTLELKYPYRIKKANS